MRRESVQDWPTYRLLHGSPVSSVEEPAANTQVDAWLEPGKAGPIQASIPRALNADEIRRITKDFVFSARRAIEAGFDGIELMAANGFLFDQFLSGALNTRTDEYGGSVDTRHRFLLETLDALAAAIGSPKVAVRFSPFGGLYDMRPYAEEAETWMSVAEALNDRDLAYVHLNYQPTIAAAEVPAGFGARFRQTYRGTLIAAGGFNREIAEAELEKGDLDLLRRQRLHYQRIYRLPRLRRDAGLMKQI